MTPLAPRDVTPSQGVALQGGHMSEGTEEVQKRRSAGTVLLAEDGVISEEIVAAIRALKRAGKGIKHVARELDIARNTVRKYWDEAVPAKVQRPRARRFCPTQVDEIEGLYVKEAEGNAVVVRDLLAEKGVLASLRTVQRLVQPIRQARRVQALATTRFETRPGEQLQIDFGERKVTVGGAEVTVYLFVATLGFSRRTFVRAGLSQRQGEWFLGLEGALRHFGGVPQQVLVDNARALIASHTGDVVAVHPAFHSMCADWGLTVRACRPYRARTKGKVESGVKYVKRNAIAGRTFTSLDALQQHLQSWMAKADGRIHGTTGRRPIEAFQEQEAAALGPLPSVGVPVQHLRRTVANDSFFDLDRVRYSVPHRLTRRTVEVRVAAEEVTAWADGKEVARHRRGNPGERIVDPVHFAGLHRGPELVASPEVPVECGPLAALGRSLAEYAEVLGGAA